MLAKVIRPPPDQPARSAPCRPPARHERGRAHAAEGPRRDPAAALNGTGTGSLLKRLALVTPVQDVDTGTVLQQAGSLVDRVVVVLKGAVELRVRTQAGPRVLHLVRAGGVVGDAAALSGVPAPFTVVAARPSRVLRIEPDRLFALLATDPALWQKWMRSLADRLLTSYRYRFEVLYPDLTARVAALLLLEQTTSTSGPPRVNLPQERMAQILGASRQSVSQTLSEFRRRGLVRTGYRTLTLHDVDELSAIAGEPIGASPHHRR